MLRKMYVKVLYPNFSSLVLITHVVTADDWGSFKTGFTIFGQLLPHVKFTKFLEVISQPFRLQVPINEKLLVYCPGPSQVRVFVQKVRRFKKHAHTE
jgi:hypothetical protein